MTIAAERVLEPDGTIIRLHVPEQEPELGDWTCTFEVGDHSMRVWGIDPFQALTLALTGLESYVQSAHPGATFYGQPNGGLPHLSWPDTDAGPPPVDDE